MDIVKDFLYLSSKPLAWMLFESCVITDVLPTSFIHQSILQRQERIIDNLGTLVSKRTKHFMLQLVRDNEHFIHDFIVKCLSERYWHMKYRTSLGKDCFLRHFMCLTLNDNL